MTEANSQLVWRKLGLRFLSALVAIGIVLTFMAFGFWGGLILNLLVSLGVIIEFDAMVFGPTQSKLFRFSFYVSSFICFFSLASQSDYQLSSLIIAQILLTSLVVLRIDPDTEMERILNRLGSASLGLIYCGVFTGLGTSVLLVPQGHLWFLGLLVIVFCGDSAAYFAGKFWGQRKLAEHLSPMKTIEGSIGGLSGSLAGGIFFFYYLMHFTNLATAFGLSILMGLLAQVGDLFESLLKRAGQTKDSGQIMPGHGGLMDRVDGVIFAAPVFAILVHWLN